MNIGGLVRISRNRRSRYHARQRISRTLAEMSYDVTAWLVALAVARLAAGDLSTWPDASKRAAVWLAAVLVVPPAAGLLAGLYRSRRQRGSLDEVTGVFVAAGLSAAAFGATSQFFAPSSEAAAGLVLVALAIALPAMLTGRFILIAARQRARATASAEAIKVIVFGAGMAGAQLIHALLTQPDSRYLPVALLDDNPDKRRLRIHGVPVLGDRTAMAAVAADTDATVVVIAIAAASGTAIRDLTVEAERCGLVPKVVPSVAELLSGGVRIEGVRDPRITDLLGRRQVSTDLDAMAGQFAGKRILVTGAGGSIGSELCRQLCRFGPAELIMLDRDESAMHAVQLELHGRALLDTNETVLADIRDRQRMMEVFAQRRPEIVFHAAALKHLPLLERYPAEALKSNIWGTYSVLCAAAASGASSFVNISTDKAADPVSVLGYSKRIAERLTAHVARRDPGKFLSVRFGNVLGSRGSVLTALSEQIASGGPVTITHPEVSRYFMTANEAVQLVLQAAVIGRSGEVLVLDMGQQVRIADIARRLIATCARPARIEFTGLRPGEKLTESLLGDGEEDERPFHPLISHVPVLPLAPALTDLDPGLGAEELRAQLASCAYSGRQEDQPPAGDGLLVVGDCEIPLQQQPTRSSTSPVRSSAVSS